VDQLRDYADIRLLDGCIFCDAPSGKLTRDHVPSRVLLDRPFPQNLPIVSACETCNNGFSLDEEYLACLIDCCVAGTTDPQMLRREVVRRIMHDKPALRDRIERSRQVIGDKVHFALEPARVDNVIRKLARGHAAFELSTALRREPDSFRWWVIASMSEQQFEDFDAAHVHGLLGEIGSRSTQRMMVVTATLGSTEGGSVVVPLLMSDWVDVQQDRYRYVAVDDVNGFSIKIVIGEYLACEVQWLSNLGHAATPNSRG